MYYPFEGRSHVADGKARFPVQPLSQEICPPGPNFLGNMAPGGPHFGNLAPFTIFTVLKFGTLCYANECHGIFLTR